MDDPLSAASILQRCPAGCDGGAQPRLDRRGPGRPVLTLGACAACAGWGWIVREPDDLEDVMGRAFARQRVARYDDHASTTWYMGRRGGWRGHT